MARKNHDALLARLSQEPNSVDGVVADLEDAAFELDRLKRDVASDLKTTDAQKLTFIVDPVVQVIKAAVGQGAASGFFDIKELRREAADLIQVLGGIEKLQIETFSRKFITSLVDDFVAQRQRSFGSEQTLSMAQP
jgi:hypothetical protein